MSILIADSGSTKTHWVVISKAIVIKEIFGIGLNPYFVNQEKISEDLYSNFSNLQEREGVEHIFFYGSGCSTPEKSNVVYSSLREAFTNAVIAVESDLLASARAVFGNSAGISCILGTGSNVAVFDGQNFTANINSLGYVLGDQASGAYIGKELVRSFFQFEMPEELRIEFQNDFNIDLSTLLDKVYKSEFPNRYLASFTLFASKNIQNEFIKELITNSIKGFINHQLGTLSFDKNNYKVGFVGSVAYFFKDILTAQLELNGYKVGKIIKAPMEGLLEYQLKNTL